MSTGLLLLTMDSLMPVHLNTMLGLIPVQVVEGPNEHSQLSDVRPASPLGRVDSAEASSSYFEATSRQRSRSSSPIVPPDRGGPSGT